MEGLCLLPSSLALFLIVLGSYNLQMLVGLLTICLLFFLGNIDLSLEFIELTSFFFMADEMSLLMFLMSLLVVKMSVWASESELNSNLNFGWISICFQSTSVICLVAFSCVNLFSFFIAYEMSVIPMVALIIFWGAQPERMGAVMVMIIYTLLGSVPLLVLILWWWTSMGSDSMVVNDIMLYQNLEESTFPMSDLMILGIISFLVKSPMYGVHGWLPKAHVEAPVSGSMILAGILLKLGGYGLIRFMWCFNVEVNFFTNLTMVLSAIGACIASLACLNQSDLKRLIAFSSVSHMGMVLSSVMSMSDVGVKVGVFMMFAHGLSSPCLFYLMSEVSVNRKSRSSIVCKGFLVMDPMISLVWFIMSSLNLGCPPSISYFSEIFIVSVVLFYSYWLMILALVSFLAGLFSMVLFCSINHGSKSWKMDYKQVGSSRPFVVNLFSALVSFFWFFVLWNAM
uniref:NADH-ubiquinone oxidoreductase chain 4 n=1 Tax=Hiatella arctica TaxID=120431 RepID=Q06SB8_9BIVA|nr:NADH dehydrogenase subunit 4 [Hiatella arctica]